MCCVYDAIKQNWTFVADRLERKFSTDANHNFGLAKIKSEDAYAFFKLYYHRDRSVCSSHRAQKFQNIFLHIGTNF